VGTEESKVGLGSKDTNHETITKPTIEGAATAERYLQGLIKQSV